jgi:pimeloyl-ACP methyl ester carboxylesterase
MGTIAAGAVSVLQSALIALGIVTAVWGIWMFFRQSRIVFRPSRELLGDPGDVGLAFDDVYLALPNRVRVHGWWIPGDDLRKVILCFPGSIGNISHELATASFLRRPGANVLIVDYPGFGRSEGRPSETGCYLAASAAWKYAIEEKGILPENAIVFGRSLGGTVAAWLAARHPDCARLVIHSAFTSVPDLAARAYPFFPVRYFCYIRFNTLKQIRACGCPVVVMHPTADSVIPLRHSERILEEAPEPKRFVALQGDHYGREWQDTPGLQRAWGHLIMGEGGAWA